MKTLIIFLFLISLSSHGFDACKSNEKITCNEGDIKSIEDDLQVSLGENYDIVLKELIKLKLNEKYDHYINKVIRKELDNIKLCRKNQNQEICKEVIPKYKNGIEKMRVSLALFNPPGKIENFNFRNEDIFEENIKHFSFVDAEKPEKLTLYEKKLSEMYFRHIYDEHIEENKILTKPKEFLDVLKLNDAQREVRVKTMDISREMYLESIMNMPVLKYIKKPLDEVGLEDIELAYEKLTIEITKKKEKLNEISKEEFKQLYLFDGLMSEVLADNSFLCQAAISTRNKINEDRSFWSNIYTFGGLALCPFTGIGCTGVMFGGSVVNLVDSKNRLDTSLKFSLDSSTLSREKLNKTAENVGADTVMVLLSTPISIAGKIGMKKIGVEKVSGNVTNYFRAIKKEGARRAILKEDKTLYQYSFNNGKGILLKEVKTPKDVYKYIFKQVNKKPDVHDYIDYIVHAPVLGVSKLLTRKSFTLQPFESSITLLEGKFLKKGVKLAGPLSLAGNIIDFRIIMTGYEYLYDKSIDFIKNKGWREEYAKARFHNFSVDSRFEKVRQIEAQCKNSKICSENSEELVDVHTNLVLDGDMYLKNKLIELNKLGIKESDQVSDISEDPKLMSYASAIFPYFYERFPDYQVGEELTEIQRKTLELDILKLKVADSLKNNEIQNVLTETGKISDGFAKFLISSRNARSIITSKKPPEVYKALGVELNRWIRVNQGQVLN